MSQVRPAGRRTSAAGLTRAVAFEVTNTHFLARLVGQGLGVAMLPSAYVPQLGGVTTIQVTDAPARVEYAVWPPGSRTPAATALLRLIGVLAAPAAPDAPGSSEPPEGAAT